MAKKTKKIINVVDPTANQEAATKKYVDDEVGGILLDDIGNPSGNHTFTMANKQLKFVYTAPATAAGGFEIEASGGFSGDLMHVHQHTGNPGAVDLVHLEADDADVTVLRAASSGATHKFTGAALDVGTQKITSVVDPTNNQDAATKKYVDDNAGAAGITLIGEYTAAGGQAQFGTGAINTAAYSIILVKFYCDMSGAANPLLLLNGDTTAANYDSSYVQYVIDSHDVLSNSYIIGTSHEKQFLEIEIWNWPAGVGRHYGSKTVTDDGDTAGMNITGRWTGTDEITSITFANNAAKTFDAASKMRVYGIV